MTIKKVPSEWGDNLAYFDEETYITAEKAVDRDELKGPPGQLVAPTKVIIRIKSIHPSNTKNKGYVQMSIKLETLIKTPKWFGFKHPTEHIIKENTFDGEVYIGDSTTVAGLLQKVDIGVD